ncbi:MAG: SDR family NAD(P)-dependent oxidoreductase [Pseudomonadota bacterium]
MAYNPQFNDWRGKNVWIIGASSGIGQATASALHAEGAKVFVSARNAAALKEFEAAHPGAVGIAFDASDAASFAEAARAVMQSGPLALAMYCAGYYKAMRADAFDLGEMLRHQQVNYVGALHLLDAVLPDFVRRQEGHVSLISSVAGYRGLPKSLAYGPTKAALINLAETLYVDLHDKHIGVSLINPGFVETPLTAQNRFSMPALITPAQAAAEILSGWKKGEFEIHFPKRFTRWMKTLQMLPYAAYFPVVKRLVKEEDEYAKQPA